MDRISHLPNEILCHILSFLPTKDAAVTHVLSKRWLHLWKLVPNLDIDDSVFLHPEEGKAERGDIQQGFVDFVEGVLAMQGDSPIEKFSLKCVTGIHPDIVNRWICIVLRRGVSDLNLFLGFTDADTLNDPYQLPGEMFVSRTLVKLELRSETCVYWWRYEIGGSFLPMLKSLTINAGRIYVGEMETFISLFPVLEEIWMANLEWPGRDMSVSSARLRKLTLLGTGGEGPLCHPKSVSFNCPNLLFLNYTNCVAEDYPIVNTQNLLGARIDLLVNVEDQVKENNDEGDGGLQFGNVVKLMNGLQNVQKLSLVADTLEVVSLWCESMPVFNNLKFLGVTMDNGRGWQVMPVLLRNCPHLETLVIGGLVHDVTDKCRDACPCISREEKGRSLASCPVNRIEIQGFRATMKEMEMIHHFLDYFPCLKRLDIFAKENDPPYLRDPKVTKQIVEMFDLYKKSPSCKVELLFCGYLDKKWLAQGYM